MNVAVVGLGYVGCVACAKLVQAGHDVTGVDINAVKVRQINEGRPTVAEPGLGALMEDALASGRLRAVTNIEDAVARADVYYVCVGTPNTAAGDLNLAALFRVVDEIRYLHAGGKRKTLLVRSTVKPGTCRKIADIVGENRLSVVSNPEFLREGQALSDWDDPGMVVIGALDDKGFETAEALYANIDAPVYRVAPEAAEMIKYVNNSWHALKVAFGNEVGRIAAGHGVPVDELMDVFIADTKLNISSKYLRPGMPYGGSCLTKDLKGLSYLAREQSAAAPVLEAVDASNAAHVRYHLERIRAAGGHRVGFYGLTFKPKTDDLRGSPALTMLKALADEGVHVAVYDSVLSHLDEADMRNNHILSRDLWLQGLLRPSLEELCHEVDIVVACHPLDADAQKKLDDTGKPVHAAYVL